MPETAKGRRLRPGPVCGALEGWLPPKLEGADHVRGEVARRLALELDSRQAPPHAVPRLANALLAAVDAIEAQELPAGDLDVRRLLEEAFR